MFTVIITKMVFSHLTFFCLTLLAGGLSLCLSIHLDHHIMNSEDTNMPLWITSWFETTSKYPGVFIPTNLLSNCPTICCSWRFINSERVPSNLSFCWSCIPYYFKIAQVLSHDIPFLLSMHLAMYWPWSPFSEFLNT